jgi:nitrogenase molybdenum-iron protein NifN
MLPDYSETLDGSSWETYKHIPDGGTSLSEIERTGDARCSVQFGKVFNKAGKTGERKVETAASFLDGKYGVEAKTLPWPLGVEACDMLFEYLSSVSGNEIPLDYRNERGRLIDAYADGHKYVFGKKAVIYGEEDLVIAFYRFLSEIGIDVAIVASGGKSGMLKAAIEEIAGNKPMPIVMDDTDFEDIASAASGLDIDILIGHSKGYYIARKLGVPLVRIGFPVHDRLGGQRIRHLGCEGTNELFERIVNAIIESTQNRSEVGYKYM